MKHYEYKIVQPEYPYSVSNYNQYNDIAAWLTKMDSEGWQFVSIDYPRTYGDGETLAYMHQYYIFRKEIKSTESIQSIE